MMWEVLRVNVLKQLFGKTGGLAQVGQTYKISYVFY